MYYEAYFGLKQPPFSISPDPRYLFLTRQHREALAHLLYGVSGQGAFVLLTGEIGAGKTIICQGLMHQLPQNTDVAYILNPRLEPREFLSAICDELHITLPSEEPIAGGIKQYLVAIAKYLLVAHRRGRNTVLMVDEAQNLSVDVIEHLRLLTNLETREKKLLQIMLVGQPELREKIALPELRQMAQRITARFHLNPLSKNEVAAYVKHRLKIAGADRTLFEKDCFNSLWKLTRGVPRLINIICDRALLGAFVSGKKIVDKRILERAAVEVLGDVNRHQVPIKKIALWTVLLLLVCTSAFVTGYFYRQGGLRTILFSDNQSQVPGMASQQLTSIDSSGLKTTAGVNQSNFPDGSERGAKPVISPDSKKVVVTNQPLPYTGLAAGNANHQKVIAEALAALFGQWRVQSDAQTTESACSSAQQHNLGCLQCRADLGELRNLNRPALLAVTDDLGQTGLAVLTRLRGNNAELIINNSHKTISAGQLADRMADYCLVLWKMPPGYVSAMVEGTGGPPVQWLWNRFGRQTDKSSAVFTHDLAERVKQFQLEQGLLVDGIVGPRTIIAINNLQDVGIAKLDAQEAD